MNALKLERWQTEEKEDIGVNIFKFDHSHIIPNYEIYVDSHLDFFIRVFGWKLPVQHEIYQICKKSCKNVTLCSIISVVNGYTICCGILEIELTDFGSFINHCIPKKCEATDTGISPLHQTEFHRALSCQILTATNQCNDCISCERNVAKGAKRKRDNLAVPAKLNAPISQTSTERVIFTLQGYRAENRALKAQIEEIRQELESSAVPVSQDLRKDLTDIMSGIDEEKIPPFMRLFWEEQKNYLSSSKTGIRYHPMDLECGLHLLPRLTYNHIRLNSYSVMNVKLAAQVLSSTVSCTLQKFGPTDAQATAKFCEMMDKFFDCLNVRNTKEHIMKQKPTLMPYTSTGDERFGWLNNTFLQYFKDWLSSIERKPGKYSKGDKANMFISYQTYEGLQITVKSVTELTNYLLSHGIQYILTERFCQDPLENYFGRQRAIGQRKDNPTMRDFGCSLVATGETALLDVVDVDLTVHCMWFSRNQYD
eukprot:Seg4408.1 transcript_id=Seg4408.1/GoldUCD/mRNA.D3Y31 product="Transposable element P transposase" protein_id=Seg4408.1/GoldUCD/D3Y31